MSVSSSILALSLGLSIMPLVERLPESMKQCSRRRMSGCLCNQRIIFSTGNPGVIGGPNGMYLKGGGVVLKNYKTLPNVSL